MNWMIEAPTLMNLIEMLSWIEVVTCYIEFILNLAPVY